jgi:hypothetical protein
LFGVLPDSLYTIGTNNEVTLAVVPPVPKPKIWIAPYSYIAIHYPTNTIDPAATYPVQIVTQALSGGIGLACASLVFYVFIPKSLYDSSYKFEIQISGDNVVHGPINYATFSNAVAGPYDYLMPQFSMPDLITGGRKYQIHPTIPDRWVFTDWVQSVANEAATVDPLYFTGPFQSNFYTPNTSGNITPSGSVFGLSFFGVDYVGVQIDGANRSWGGATANLSLTLVDDDNDWDILSSTIDLSVLSAYP